MQISMEVQRGVPEWFDWDTWEWRADCPLGDVRPGYQFRVDARTYTIGNTDCNAMGEPVLHVIDTARHRAAWFTYQALKALTDANRVEIIYSGDDA